MEINGKHKKMSIKNTLKDYAILVKYCQSLKTKVVFGFEATGNYHRPLAFYLQKHNFHCVLISSLAVARTRQALYNSWDKNDPKDAQVILHLMKTGVHQFYYDPLKEKTNDLREVSNTYFQISLRKTRLLHQIKTHFFPLYFPEIGKFLHSTRAEAIIKLLIQFPIPEVIIQHTKEKFLELAIPIYCRKRYSSCILEGIYEVAKQSIGLPVCINSQAVYMFRLVLKEYLDLIKRSQEVEKRASALFENNKDYKLLRTIPGVGPIIALTILAEAGDLRRFSHYKKFIKFCGMNLSTQQSGMYRGFSKPSKHGNTRLRNVFWLAAVVAIRQTENSFRNKFESYIRKDRTNADLKRKAYFAISVKMARVTHSLIKEGLPYRRYFEEQPS